MCREVKDQDELNEFLCKEIHLVDMLEKVKEEFTECSPAKTDKKVDVLLQREQTIDELQKSPETVQT